MHLVGEVRLELDRARRLQDFVVDEAEAATIKLDFVVLAVGNNRQRRLALQLLLLDLRQQRLRQGEDQGNRFDLRDDHDAVGIGRGDNVADVNLANARDAVDWRGQPRVAQLRLGGLDERLVGLDRILQLRNLCFLGFEQLWGCKALLLARLIAIEIGNRVGELRLIAIAGCGHLIDLCLIGARVDLSEEIAGVHRLALGEIDADDLPLDLGANGDRIIGDHGADPCQIDRHVVLSDRCGNHRYNGRCRQLWREFWLNVEGEGAATGEDGNGQRRNYEHFFAHHSSLPISTLFSDQQNAQTRGRKAWTWFRPRKVKMNPTWKLRAFPQRRVEMTLQRETSLRTRPRATIGARPTVARTPAPRVG